MSGHAPHADVSDPFQKKVAITLAMFAALLAFTTMLTNQARTRSLLLSNEAANQWAYFQSKSTKGIVTRAELELMDLLVAARPTPTGEDGLRVRLVADVVRYDLEKDEIKAEAERITSLQQDQEHREHWFEYASTLAELAIVVASVSLLFGSRPVFFTGVAIGVGALGLAAWTALLMEHAHAPAEHHERAKTPAPVEGTVDATHVTDMPSGHGESTPAPHH